MPKLPTYMKPKRPLTIRVDEETRRLLTHHLQRRRVTASQYVRELLQRELAKV